MNGAGAPTERPTVLHALLIYSDPNAAPDYSSPEGEAEFRQWMSYTEELGASGALKAGKALQPVETATSVRLRDGEQLVTDGPFAETKETLGGYYLLDVPDLDTATEWAKKLPIAEYGSVEIRPVQEF